MTLHDPVYDAEAATLTYNVTFIPQRHVGSIANFYRKHKSMPSFSKVILSLLDSHVPRSATSVIIWTTLALVLLPLVCRHNVARMSSSSRHLLRSRPGLLQCSSGLGRCAPLLCAQRVCSAALWYGRAREPALAGCTQRSRRSVAASAGLSQGGCANLALKGRLLRAGHREDRGQSVLEGCGAVHRQF